MCVCEGVGKRDDTPLFFFFFDLDGRGWTSPVVGSRPCDASASTRNAGLISAYAMSPPTPLTGISGG